MEPDKQGEKEYRKHPWINLKDAMDRAQMGDLRLIGQLGCWPTVILLAILLGLIVVSVIGK